MKRCNNKGVWAHSLKSGESVKGEGINTLQAAEPPFVRSQKPCPGMPFLSIQEIKSILDIHLSQ